VRRAVRAAVEPLRRAAEARRGVTGSVNQNGEVQPIGGVNRKIEGYFDVCRMIGLSGDQGVLIPARNERNLMLRKDVLEAVRKGKFHVWAVSTIEEGLRVLTGAEPGVPGRTEPTRRARSTPGRRQAAQPGRGRA